MFSSGARSSPKREAPERHSAWVGSSLSHKHYDRLERLARDKFDSLFGYFVSNKEKVFTTLTSCLQVIKLDFLITISSGSYPPSVMRIKYYVVFNPSINLNNFPFFITDDEAK
jgi:hypothetical protein